MASWSRSLEWPKQGSRCRQLLLGSASAPCRQPDHPRSLQSSACSSCLALKLPPSHRERTKGSAERALIYSDLFWREFWRKKSELIRTDRGTFWHEIIMKIDPRKLFFIVFEGVCILKMPRERKTISRNYAWNSYFFSKISIAEWFLWAIILWHQSVQIPFCRPQIGGPDCVTRAVLGAYLKHDSQGRDRILRAFPPPRYRAIFSTF